MALSPSVFIGNANALVEPVNNAPHPSGTRIVFSCEETDCSLGLMVHEAAKYYPLQVTVNTTVARRRPFLQDTVYTETWNGLIIGVSRDPYDARSRGINFHGSVVQHARLPGTTTVSADGQKKDARWTAEVDVEDCEQLELVLPSRRQVIQNVFLKKLEEEAQRVVYRAIAASETPRTLQHSDWAEARALGVELPEPVQELQRWQARTADAWENDNRCCNQPPPLVRKAGQRIVRMDEYNFSAAEQVTIERAFNENGENTVLVASQPVFEGYEKYDEIEVATELRTIIEKDVATTTVEEHQKAGTPLPNGRPERIVFELKTRNSKGQEHTIRAESDLAFSGETAITPGEIRVLLTTRSEITSDELTNLMIDAYFYATEDVDDGDTQRQLEHYERDCRTRATTLIHSPAEARLERLKELAGTYIANELQPGERLVIEGGTEGRHRTELCKPGPQAAPQEGPPSLGALGTVEEGEDNRNSPADL